MSDANETGSGETGSTNTPMIREAVAIFESVEGLEAAIDELTLAGFERHQLSLMARDEDIRERFGRTVDHVEAAKDDPNVPRMSYVSPEELGDAQGFAMGVAGYVGAVIAGGAIVASGGTLLVAALGAAAAGVGTGAGGGLLARWLGEQRGDVLQSHLDKGGLLLWVNLASVEDENRAREILSRHTDRPVEVHEIAQTQTTSASAPPATTTDEDGRSR